MGQRAGQRADAASAQRRERSQGESAPHDELLGEREVRTRDRRLGTDRGRILDAVQRDVEVPSRQRGQEVAPVVLYEPGAHAQPAGQTLRDLHLESFQVRRVSGVPIDVRLAALQVPRPAELALLLDARQRAGGGERQEQQHVPFVLQLRARRKTGARRNRFAPLRSSVIEAA